MIANSHIFRSVRVGEAGLPQGSHLDPTPFMLYINDLPSVIKHLVIFVYADDVILFHSSESIEGFGVLRFDLFSLRKWREVNRVSSNISKRKTNSFSRTLAISEKCNSWKLGLRSLTILMSQKAYTCL